MEALSLIQNNFNFVEEVESLKQSKNVEYIDAIVMWCDSHKLDIETAANWIKSDPVMKAKVQVEAENLNILKRGARLPL